MSASVNMQSEFFDEAFNQARLALALGEVPVGCAFVKAGQVIASAHNLTSETRDATQHCEIVAASRVDVEGSELYVTVEPCIMCAEALRLLKVKSVWYGCSNSRFGGNGSILSLHEGSYSSNGGFRAEEAIDLLKEFYSRGNVKAPAEKRHRELQTELI
mmetsp:Transcript_12935/g.24024  ORF Transcript_12935/g.24024 Transcript_12935/m.24024 type:complete len:159 (+) Transcript_12935:933-1409(+)|eukprot:CAMPEP_0204896556 /NCGR_PEP_ID=MMETSP1397-20131031/228_1 /ASSEMBLY_ACC=CAM_ASM_000891 /TAXON_ID=49980 /ORGANISM="Climacostomum Climacostomum virens, Strain Stock W-24" /LENGTH=158 /DNA_ID=CAMNT_0052064181 /DNA_START=45 /DNA_END=521 /DNA_ORIENTATION=-